MQIIEGIRELKSDLAGDFIQFSRDPQGSGGNWLKFLGTFDINSRTASDN